MNVLVALKSRRRNLRRRIKEERAAFARLKNKSHRVRVQSRLPARIGWFTDRLGELDLVIQLVEGKISAKDFKSHLAGDALDQMLCGL